MRPLGRTATFGATALIVLSMWACGHERDVAPAAPTPAAATAPTPAPAATAPAPAPSAPAPAPGTLVDIFDDEQGSIRDFPLAPLAQGALSARPGTADVGDAVQIAWRSGATERVLGSCSVNLAASTRVSAERGPDGNVYVLCTTFAHSREPDMNTVLKIAFVGGSPSLVGIVAPRSLDREHFDPARLTFLAPEAPAGAVPQGPLPHDIANLRAGRRYWAVYLVVEESSTPAIASAAERARARGFHPTQGTLGCDDGASQALGRSDGAFHVAIYFDTEAHARAAAAGIAPAPVGVARVTPGCND